MNEIYRQGNQLLLISIVLVFYSVIKTSPSPSMQTKIVYRFFKQNLCLIYMLVLSKKEGVLAKSNSEWKGISITLKF